MLCNTEVGDAMPCLVTTYYAYNAGFSLKKKLETNMFTPEDLEYSVTAYFVRPLFTPPSKLSSKGTKSSFVSKYFGELILSGRGRKHVCPDKVFCALGLKNLIESKAISDHDQVVELDGDDPKTEDLFGR